MLMSQYYYLLKYWFDMAFLHHLNNILHQLHLHFSYIFDNINLNEYKKVLMPDEKMPFRCGFSIDETNNINLNICNNAFELVKDENAELHIPIIILTKN